MYELLLYIQYTIDTESTKIHTLGECVAQRSETVQLISKCELRFSCM